MTSSETDGLDFCGGIVGDRRWTAAKSSIVNWRPQASKAAGVQENTGLSRKSRGVAAQLVAPLSASSISHSFIGGSARRDHDRFMSF
jgi:hypothetical protein